MAESIVYSSSSLGGGDSWEIGDIRQTLKTDLDDTWLLCNGENVDENEYPDLYSKLFDITPIQSYGTEVVLANNSSDNAFLATKGIIYANGNFIIYGQNVDGNGHGIMYSSDITLSGDQWTTADNSGKRIYRLWFTNNRFIALIPNSSNSPALRVYSDVNFTSYTDYNLNTSDWGRAGIGVINGYPIEGLTYFNGYYYCGYNESTANANYPCTITSGIMRTTNFSSWEKKQLMSVSYERWYGVYPSNSGLSGMAVNPDTGEFCVAIFKGEDGFGETLTENEENCKELICRDNFNNFSNLTVSQASSWYRRTTGSLNKLVTYNKTVDNFFSTMPVTDGNELYPLSTDNRWYSNNYTLRSSVDFNIVSLGSDNYNSYVYMVKESEDNDMISLIQLDCSGNLITEQNKLIYMPSDSPFYMYEDDVAAIASNDKYLVFHYWRLNNTTKIRENVIVYFDKEAKSIPELASDFYYYYIKAKG